MQGGECRHLLFDLLTLITPMLVYGLRVVPCSGFLGAGCSGLAWSAGFAGVGTTVPCRGGATACAVGDVSALTLTPAELIIIIT
jgi:hypothetical protein